MPDYLVKVQPKPADADGNLETTERLVRAKNKSDAANHVISDSLFVVLATTEDIIRLAGEGVKLEKAA